jgi:hypothetical protein
VDAFSLLLDLMAMNTGPPAPKVPPQSDLFGETQPLLGGGTQPGPANGDELENGVVGSNEAPPDKTGWKTWTSYGVLTVVGIVLLTLLIKGLIDAGDVDVSFAHC